MGTRGGVPVPKDLVCLLRNRLGTCGSSPFDDVCPKTGWSHPYQWRSSPSRRGRVAEGIMLPRRRPTTLLRVALVETVVAPTRMPAHDGATMPSCGGREGIVGTGLSCHPKENPRTASFLYYSYHKKVGKIHHNHQSLRRACRAIFNPFSSR